MAGNVRTLRLCGWLGLALTLAGCTTTKPPPDSRPWHTTLLGLCEDYPEETRSLSAAGTDLAEARRAGARVLRVAFGWDAIEPEQGRYDWSFWDDFVRLAIEEHGLRLVPYVCYTPRWAATDPNSDDYWRSPPRDPEDFARFMSVIARRYGDAISSWELWNEPDNRAYWLGTREQFAALVRAGSRAVREAVPHAQVVLGGIAIETDFLEGLFASDAIAPAVDVVNVHSYFETWHPDTIETLPTFVARAARIVREHGENEPLWMAEVGYSSAGPEARESDVYRSRHSDEHTVDAQADALARTLVLALSTGRLPLVAWYRINDLAPSAEVIGDSHNRHLGIRTVAGLAKPALSAFAQISRWFSGPYQIVTPNLRITSKGSTAEAHAFRLADGRTVIASWIGAPESRPVNSSASGDAPPAVDERHARLMMTVPRSWVRSRSARVTGSLGNTLPLNRVRWNASPGGDRLQFELHGGEVLFVELDP